MSTGLPLSEYLSIAEAAALLRVSSKRIRNLMYLGKLRRGVHWTSPDGIGPRFKRAALVAWIEERETPDLAPEGRAFAGLEPVDRRRRRA